MHPRTGFPWHVVFFAQASATFTESPWSMSHPWADVISLRQARVQPETDCSPRQLTQQRGQPSQLEHVVCSHSQVLLLLSL